MPPNPVKTVFKDARLDEAPAGISRRRSLNSKELVSAALKGLPNERPVVGPLAVHFCAKQAGVSLRDDTLNARMLAESVICYYECFRPDAVWLSADTWVTAEAMGAAVPFPADDQPLGGTGERLIRSGRDLEKIPPPNPGAQGRYPVMNEALRRIRQALGRDVFIVACFDQ